MSHIIDHIVNMSKKTYVSTSTIYTIKIYLNEILLNFSNKLSVNEKKHIGKFSDMLNPKLKLDNVTFNKLRNIVVEIINNVVVGKNPGVEQQVKSLNEGLDGESNEQTEELSSEEVDEQLDKQLNKILEGPPDIKVDEVINIEAELDNQIEEYTKHTIKHPMPGVRYLEREKKYRIVVGNFKSNIIKMEDACSKALEKMKAQNQATLCPDNVLKIFFKYKDVNFVVYNIDSLFFFDILHIFSILTLGNDYIKKKHLKFRDRIEHRIWQKNKFGGYIVRELISEATMYELIMSSSSDFSKSFKKDVSGILVKLRSNNLLTIKDDTLQLSDNIQEETKMDNAIEPVTIMQNADQDCNTIVVNNTNQKTFPHNSPEDCNLIRKLIRNGSHVTLTEFINKNVIYLVLIAINNSNNFIIIKIGFTDNITDRLRTLKLEYKADVTLLAARYVNTRSEEEHLHRLLHIKYPECVFNYAINGKNKNELYVLSQNIVNEFSKINPVLNKDINDNIFQNLCDNNEFVENDLCFNNKLKYDYLTVVENNSHQLKQLDKVIELKQLELKLEHELKLKQLEIELLDKQILLAQLKK